MMSPHEQRAMNRARQDAYYRKLIRQPDYSYFRWLAKRMAGLLAQRQWRARWAQMQRGRMRLVAGGRA